MALNPTTLSSALRVALLANPDVQSVDDVALTGLCDAIAQTVVAHIVSSAIVTVAPGIAVATTGTAAAQTGATTAPGTGVIT